MIERRGRSRWPWALLVLTAGVLPGCGGGPGESLSARPKSTELGGYVERPLEVPKDVPFSITLAPSQKSPGLEGKADASADVSADGAGSASASVENGGTASGTVQIGHSVRNDTARQADVSVRFAFDFEFEVNAIMPARSPEANVSITLFARDERNRELATIACLKHASDQGTASGKSSKELDLTLTLGPGQSANVYLAALAGASTEPGRKAFGRVTLRSVRMVVTTRPAPAVGSASDASP